MTRIELPSAYVPIPHALILDAAVSANAVRLYGVLHYLGWQHKTLDSVRDLIAAWPVELDEQPPTERSMYRWLSQLERAGWATYARAPGRGGLADRIQLHAHKQARDVDEAPADTPGPLTLRSEDAQTSDTTIRPSDSRVRAPDSRVRATRDTAHTDAAKTSTQILRQSLMTDPPPPEQRQTRAERAGGGGDVEIVRYKESEQLLQRFGVSTSKARELAVHTPDRVRAAILACPTSATKPAGWVANYLQTQPLDADPQALREELAQSQPQPQKRDKPSSRAITLSDAIDGETRGIWLRRYRAATDDDERRDVLRRFDDEVARARAAHG